MALVDQRVEMAAHIAAIVQAGELVGDRHFQAELHVVAQPVGIALLAQLGAHARDQFVLVHRAGEIIVDAHFQRLGQLAAVAVADQHEDRHVAAFRQRAKLRAQAQAVEAAHAQAHHDQVEIAAAHPDQGFLEGVDGGHFVRGRERLREPGDGFGAVLDDQDAARWRSASISVSRRIDQAHALAGRLAHAQFVGHHLQAHKAAHAREQRGIVHRLGEKIVGARVQAGDAVGRLVQRGHHHHRHMGGLGIGLDAAADFEAVHARHHHVEQNDIGLVLFDLAPALPGR